MAKEQGKDACLGISPGDDATASPHSAGHWEEKFIQSDSAASSRATDTQ
jgi:hypothetical protein